MTAIRAVVFDMGGTLEDLYYDDDAVIHDLREVIGLVT